MSWLGGVRARLTASLVAVVALTAIVLGVSASVFVDLRLHDQVLQAANEQARFDLSVVVPERQLPDRPTPEDIRLSGLADTFRRGAVETVVDLGGDARFQSDERLAGLLTLLPADMRARVDRGEIAYGWLDVAGQPSLVVGGRPAGGGPAFYFVRNVAGVDAAIDQLRAGPGGRRPRDDRVRARDLPARGAQHPGAGGRGRARRRADRARRPVGARPGHVARRIRDLGRAVQPDDRGPGGHDPPPRGGPAPEPAVRRRRVARAADAARGARRRGVDRAATISTSCPRRAAAPPSSSWPMSGGCGRSSRSSWSCRASTPRRRKSRSSRSTWSGWCGP